MNFGNASVLVLVELTALEGILHSAHSPSRGLEQVAPSYLIQDLHHPGVEGVPLRHIVCFTSSSSTLQGDQAVAVTVSGTVCHSTSRHLDVFTVSLHQDLISSLQPLHFVSTACVRTDIWIIHSLLAYWFTGSQ